MASMTRIAALGLALLLAGCAANGPGPDRASLKTEPECRVATDSSSCKRQHDLSGGYPFALTNGN